MVTNFNIINNRNITDTLYTNTTYTPYTNTSAGIRCIYGSIGIGISIYIYTNINITISIKLNSNYIINMDTLVSIYNNKYYLN